jgi:hypothetical protein
LRSIAKLLEKGLEESDTFSPDILAQEIVKDLEALLERFAKSLRIEAG